MPRRFEHSEQWGEYLDVKRCSKPLGVKRLTGRSVFMSSVTDCYNPLERKYKVTRRILEELAPIECELSILTKSKLLLRDLDLLAPRVNMFQESATLWKDKNEHKRYGIRVLTSINTLDEDFRSDMDRASTIEERLDMIKTCHENGIPTSIFVAPIFPLITDFRSIVERAAPFVDEFLFDRLNLRRGYKEDILAYIRARFPKFYKVYLEIYRHENDSFWKSLKYEIENFCDENKIRRQIFFNS